MSTDKRHRREPGWRWAERVAWSGGIAALSFWAVAVTSGVVGSRVELQRFAAARAAVAPVALPDQRFWSPARIRASGEPEKAGAPAPLGVLRIARIGLQVAVLEGTDDWTLNRGVGHIEDTALPGAPGNVAIAGHRDSYFRNLKDIRAGDRIELDTATGLDRYRVERTWIVEPDDVSVLDPTGTPSITLVTCYPFYFVGSAPQRFIVRAVRTDASPERKVLTH